MDVNVHIYTLCASERVPGTLALDDPHGAILLLHTQVILVLGMYYLHGSVQVEEQGKERFFIFVPQEGNIESYGVVLRPGMQIILM